MTDQSDAVTLAVLSSQVAGLTRTVESLENALREQGQHYVPTVLWQQRNTSVDDKFSGLGREVGELRVELRSRRVSWPAVGAFVVAAVSLAIALIQAISPTGGG